jgi:Flp pilus assembly protein TadG
MQQQRDGEQPMNDFHRRARGKGRGQALVEFALVLPIFILLLVAIFDLGRAVFAYNTLTNAAREGARIAIVNQYKPSIVARAKQQTAIVELNDPSVQVNFYQVNADGTPDTSAQCALVAVGCLAVVSFEATYQPITPLIGNIVFKNGVTFTARSVLSVEYSCPSNPLDGAAAANCPKQP